MEDSEDDSTTWENRGLVDNGVIGKDCMELQSNRDQHP
jgi:hypothetical protein